jgi:hypothetical protein
VPLWLGKKEDDSKLVKLVENPPKQASNSIMATINLIVVPVPWHVDPAHFKKSNAGQPL